MIKPHVLITSELLRVDDNLHYSFVDVNDTWDVEEFRHALRVLVSPEYVVIHSDLINFNVGVLVGYCFATNIPIIEVGGDCIHGSYASFSEDGWRKFAEELANTNKILVEIEDKR